MGGKYSCIKIEIGNHSEISCFCRLHWSTNCNPSQYLHFRLQSCYPFGRINISTKTSTAFDKATSVYTLFFILCEKACCLDREKLQSPLLKCKICRSSDILNFTYTMWTVNDVTEEAQRSHSKEEISGKLVKPPLIY